MVEGKDFLGMHGIQQQMQDTISRRVEHMDTMVDIRGLSDEKGAKAKEALYMRIFFDYAKRDFGEGHYMSPAVPGFSEVQANALVETAASIEEHQTQHGSTLQSAIYAVHESLSNATRQQIGGVLDAYRDVGYMAQDLVATEQ